MDPTTRKTLKTVGIIGGIVLTTISIFTHPALLFLGTGTIGLLHSQYTKKKEEKK